jgi:adenosine deaminase
MGKGLRRGCRQFVNLTVNQILCGITWRPEWAASTLDMATNHQYDFPCAVVGVDIAAGEEHFDAINYPDLHGPFFAMAQEAKKRNMPLTLHAGEMTSENAMYNVQRAIIEYGARRIGHGYRMTESMEIMNVVRSHDVHVEVCPTSSAETGGWMYDDENTNREWKNHPAISMLRHGISLSFSSDDPAVFHTSLSWQYRIAIAKMSLSCFDLWQMNLNAVTASWCSSEEKDRLTELIQCYGHAKLFDLYEMNHHNHNRRMSQFAWWRTKTDSFLDRVYLRNEEVKV